MNADTVTVTLFTDPLSVVKLWVAPVVYAVLALVKMLLTVFPF